MGPELNQRSQKIVYRHHIVQMPWRKLEGSRFHKIHRTLRCLRMVPLFRKEKAGKLLTTFRPELVLTVMQHATWYDSAMAYAKGKKLPLVTIVHDTNESFDKVYGWAKEAQKRADGRFYRFATERLCVSPEMEEFCFQKYRVRGEVMYPNRDESLRPRPMEMNAELRCPPHLTVGFVGNVNYGYGKALVDLLPAFEQSGARLRIWSQLPGLDCRSLCGSPLVRFEGFMSSPEVWKSVKEVCDAVILPYSNEQRMRQLYSYHFPSKLPEYLALGMPVIVTGPEYATGVRWAKKNPEAALAVLDQKPTKMVLILKKLSGDASYRKQLAAGSIKEADEKFNPEAIRERFLQVLRKAAKLEKD